MSTRRVSELEGRVADLLARVEDIEKIVVPDEVGRETLPEGFYEVVGGPYEGCVAYTNGVGDWTDGWGNPLYYEGESVDPRDNGNVLVRLVRETD